MLTFLFLPFLPVTSPFTTQAGEQGIELATAKDDNDAGNGR
jgi:hypothetical protein